MAAKTAIKGVSRTDAFWVDPEAIVLIDDPKHPLFDERVLEPVSEGLVLSMMFRGFKGSVVTLRKNGDKLEAVTGRRRILAAREVNRRFKLRGDEPIRVLAVLERGSDADAFGVSILENEGRKEVSPLEKATKAKRLMDMGKTEAEVAPLFGLEVPSFRKLLRLLDLDAKVQKKLEAGDFSAAAALKVVSLPREQQLAKLEELGDKPTAKLVEASVKRDKGERVTLAPSKAQVRALLASIGAASSAIPNAALLRWVLDGEEHPEIKRLLSDVAA